MPGTRGTPQPEPFKPRRTLMRTPLANGDVVNLDDDDFEEREPDLVFLRTPTVAGAVLFASSRARAMELDCCPTTIDILLAFLLPLLTALRVAIRS